MLVTSVTKDASQDDKTDAEYKEMYVELRGGRSLRQFCGLVGSVYSIGTWSKWELGNMAINRTMRQELRRAVGLDILPATLHEVMDGLDPDTEVVKVGSEPVNRVILAGWLGSATVTLNGTCTAILADAQGSDVTKVTSPQVARRDTRHRLTVSGENVAWLKREGLTVNEVLDEMRGDE